jgi:hypothetical protein
VKYCARRDEACVLQSLLNPPKCPYNTNSLLLITRREQVFLCWCKLRSHMQSRGSGALAQCNSPRSCIFNGRETPPRIILGVERVRLNLINCQRQQRSPRLRSTCSQGRAGMKNSECDCECAQDAGGNCALPGLIHCPGGCSCTCLFCPLLQYRRE